MGVIKLCINRFDNKSYSRLQFLLPGINMILWRLLMCNYSDFFKLCYGFAGQCMDVAFCLYTVIFIFSMDHARLVFRRCMCTLIVFLIFCNVFNWWIKYIRQQCEVFDTTSPLVISYLHFALLTYTWFFHPQAFCLDIGSIMTYIYLSYGYEYYKCSLIMPTCVYYPLYSFVRYCIFGVP